MQCPEMASKLAGKGKIMHASRAHRGSGTVSLLGSKKLRWEASKSRLPLLRGLDCSCCCVMLDAVSSWRERALPAPRCRPHDYAQSLAGSLLVIACCGGDAIDWLMQPMCMMPDAHLLISWLHLRLTGLEWAMSVPN